MKSDCSITSDTTFAIHPALTRKTDNGYRVSWRPGPSLTEVAAGDKLLNAGLGTSVAGAQLMVVSEGDAPMFVVATDLVSGNRLVVNINAAKNFCGIISSNISCQARIGLHDIQAGLCRSVAGRLLCPCKGGQGGKGGDESRIV